MTFSGAARGLLSVRPHPGHVDAFAETERLQSGQVVSAMPRGYRRSVAVRHPPHALAAWISASTSGRSAKRSMSRASNPETSAS